MQQSSPEEDRALTEADRALVEEAEATARELAVRAATYRNGRERRREARLARLTGDPVSFELVLALTDEVLRIRQPRRAARQLAELVGHYGAPGFLGPLDAAALRVGAKLAPLLPRAVMPLVRDRVRAEFAGVLVPSEPAAFARHLRRRRNEGFRLNINVLGEAVLGEAEAARRLERVIEVMDRPDVDYVSVKVSSICSQLNVAAFDDSVERIGGRLRSLYQAARRHDPPTFVNLDMEEYRDLTLTLAVFRAVLDEPAFGGTDAGIVVQAYLPDSLDATAQLCAWARERHRRSGGRIKVRLVKGANLAMETVDGELHGWPQAPFLTKAETDANYKRLLDLVLEPANDAAVRVGVASHNLFDLGWALAVARRAGATDRVELEMLEGMAPAVARAARERTGRLLLYAPVAARADLEPAISYLVRRLDENTGPENFLGHQFDLTPGGAVWEAEARRFRAAVAARHEPGVATRRVQDRAASPSASPAGSTFTNEPDTDFTVAANRHWIEGHLQRWRDRGAFVVPVVAGGEVRDEAPTAEGTEVGTDPAAPDVVAYRWVAADVALVDRAVATARRAGESWRAVPPGERRRVCDRVAAALAAARGRLVAAMAFDGGKVAAEGDTEVSEAIDLARWYGRCAEALPGPPGTATSPATATSPPGALAGEGGAPGAVFAPFGTVVVASPWNFPLAIPAGGVLAGLAAGNAVILKPAPEAVAVGWALAEACWAGGVSRDLLQFLPCRDDDAGRALITHPGVDAVLLTGSWETARRFLDWRPDLHLLAETSGKNAMVITPAADLDAAVGDLVRSAFGHAGQKCSAASLAIVEAPVYDDPAFRRQLADAVRTLRVGPGSDLRTTMGPLIRPPGGDLLRALTRLDRGESWLVEPARLGPNSQLWSPGVKLGVRAGSHFHLTECFGPVLGLLRARDLEQAIAWQNETSFGLTAGLHSLDPDEIAIWRERVEAGNLYVNRHTTGAIVRRQPFGGWKRSTFGPGAKTGGPNYLATLGTWQAAESHAPCGFAEACQAAWQSMAEPADPSGLRAEANVFRYRPLRRVLLRSEPGTAHDLAVAAAAVVGVEVSVTSPVDDPALLERLTRARDQRLRLPFDKLRVLGPVDARIRLATIDAGLWVDDVAVVADPVLELRRWVREQAVSETLHRYGNVTNRRPGLRPEGPRDA